MDISAKQSTANMTPRAIMSLFILNNKAKAKRSSMEPSVISLPNFPSDFIISTPLRKLKSVKSVMNKKQPNRDTNRPMINPLKKSNLFIPIPSI